jgi:hypothetical protein
VAFQNHTRPLLAKFTLDPDDVEHEHQVLLELSGVPGIVGPVRMVRCTRGDVLSFANGTFDGMCIVWT